jgi:hypothetical protein
MPQTISHLSKAQKSGMKRWGIATDMNVTLQKTQKSPLLINTYIISVAVLFHMQSIANRAQ